MIAKIKKYKIQIFSFILAFCIFSCISLNTFSCFADGDFNFIETFNITDTCVTSDDFSSSALLSSDNSLISTYKTFVQNNNSIVPSNQLSNNVNYNQGFSDYVAVMRSDGALVGFYLVPSGSYCVVSTRSVDIVYSEYPNHIPQNNNNIMPFYFYPSGEYFAQDNVASHDVVIDGVTRAVFSIAGNYKFVGASVACYGIDTTFSDWDKSTSSLGNNINNNFNENAANATNYLYFDDFDISYAVSGFTQGNVVMSGKPNDYQKEHSNEFTLVYSYTFRIKMVYNDVGGYKHDFTKVSSSYQVPLQTFINNDCSVVDKLSDIESSIEYDYQIERAQTLYDFLNYYGYGNGTNWIHGFDLGKVQWQICNVKCTAFLVANGDNISDTINNHSGYYSKTYNFLTGVQASNTGNSITTNNNPVEHNDTGSVNDHTDVVGNDATNHTTSNNIPTSYGGGSTSASGGSSSASTGAITITNNVYGGSGGNSFSYGGSGNGSGNTGTSTDDSMLGYIPQVLSMMKDGEDNSLEDIESIGNNNPWINVINNTWSFIPDSVWSTIITTFIIMIVLMLIAIIIRLIYNFVT